jgi:hypothetical protein
MELDDASWWMEMVQKIDQVLMLGKEEREKQKWAQGKGIFCRAIFWFALKTS